MAKKNKLGKRGRNYGRIPMAVTASLIFYLCARRAHWIALKSQLDLGSAVGKADSGRKQSEAGGKPSPGW